MVSVSFRARIDYRSLSHALDSIESLSVQSLSVVSRLSRLYQVHTAVPGDLLAMGKILRWYPEDLLAMGKILRRSVS